MKKRTLALIIACIMILSLLSACSNNTTVSPAEPGQSGQEENEPAVPGVITTQPPVQAPDTTVEMDTEASITYNLAYNPANTLNPWLQPNYDYTHHLVLSPLVLLLYAADGSEHLEYILAENIICNDDMTEFTIKLRPDIKWHDGEAFTADDVIYTASVLWYDEDFMYSARYRERQLGEWTKVDDHTVNVKYQEPYTGFLEYVSTYLMVAPEHILGGLTGEQLNTFSFDKDNFVGSGPFKYVDHVEGEYIQLTRNDDYYEPALIKDIRLQLISEETMAVLAMQSGDIDLTCGWDSVIGELDKNEDVGIYRFPEMRINMMFFNTSENMPYSDPYVRKAYASLINSKEISENIMGGMGVPYYSMYHVNSACYDEGSAYEFNIENAKAFLEEGGYTLGDDGYYQKDGERLELNFGYYQGPGSDHEKIGLVLQQYAKQAGIYMTVNNYDTETWDARRDNGTWDTIIDYFSEGLTVREAIADIDGYFGDETRHGREYFGKDLEKILELCDAARTAEDAGDMDTALAKAQELSDLLIGEAYVIPINGYVTAYVYRKGLHIESSVYDQLCFFNRMWVEKVS